MMHIVLQQYSPLAVLKPKTIKKYVDPEVQLQQYLPLAVLKLKTIKVTTAIKFTLQQYLPFTVLKHSNSSSNSDKSRFRVAIVLTVYGIETL